MHGVPQEMNHGVENRGMDTAIETTKARTNRKVPAEQWPESLDILRYLASQSLPRAIRDVALHVAAPEISTRNRLARLEALGAVVGSRVHATPMPGRHVLCTHYVITQYGRDCIANQGRSAVTAPRLSVNSVFGLAMAMNLRC
jgi:hypothetical protein